MGIDMKLHAQKLSISLPPLLTQFVEEYQLNHSYKSKSEVIQEALKLLRKKALENEYQLAAAESDSDFDTTISDGLEDETW